MWNNSAAALITVDDVTSVRPPVVDQLDRNFFLVRADRLTPRERGDTAFTVPLFDEYLRRTMWRWRRPSDRK